MLLVLFAMSLGSADPDGVQAIVGAERSFAAEAGKSGVQASFLKYAAPEAVVLRPDPVPVAKSFKSPPQNASKPDAPVLDWWPQWAGIARSGDLGFTTGPFTYGGEKGGYYFTVWKKRPDGSWAWIFDGGPPSAVPDAAKKGEPVKRLPMASRAAGSAARALAEITTVEAALASRAKTDVAAAYRPVMAEDGRLAGSELPPSNGRAGQAAELKQRPAQLNLSSLGRVASAAGDLVWSYGDACWTAAGAARRGHYVRVWQNRTVGWRLVFDELLPVPIAQTGTCPITAARRSAMPTFLRGRG
jgi:hypothetical protein